MPHDPVFKAKEQVLNRFLLCVVTIERAKQLTRGARSRVEAKYNSPVLTALGEVAEGRIEEPAIEGGEWILK